MQREEMTERLTAFESKHAVEDWRWHGWAVWPLLRTRLALSLLFEREAAREIAERRPSRWTRSLAWRRQRLVRWLGERLQPGADAPADLVFLTSGDRGERLGRGSYNTVVDPWAEAFAAEGARVTVWSLGAPRWRPLVPHVSIQRAIDRDRAARAVAPIGPAPVWFEALRRWAADALDADLAWSNLAEDLRAVVGASVKMESWLRRARPAVVVLDCWYRREALGAALAAHRLRIPVADLQHGIQGHGHPCYAGWSVQPERRYAVFPDRFWVWGEWDAESLVASNPGVIEREQVDVVGHRWLASWVAGEDPRRRRMLARAARRVGERQAVLVTLQDGVPYRDELVALMRQAPRDWLWLVRLHRRSRATPAAVGRELARASGRSVDAVGATRLPLYALMRHASAHVTGFSTCALEALAFGVPTLLLHESGGHAFAPFVAEQVMAVHRTPEQSVSWLADRAPQLGDACRRAADRVFGAPLVPAAVLERMAG